MIEKNIEAIAAALQAVHEANNEYVPLHEAYLTAMQSSGAYEPVPEYEPKQGESLTPAAIISMMETGEITKTGITNAVNAGKIRKITAVKSPELVTAELNLTAAIDTYHEVCTGALGLISVKKTGSRKSGSTGAAGDVGAGKQADVTAAIRRMDPDATVSFNGRRVFGTLSTGASFDYDAYGQSYLQSISKMLTQ